MKPNRDFYCLKEIIGYCDKIQKILSKFNSNYEIFLNSLEYQYSISFCIFQIGECCNSLSDEFKNTHTHVEWRVIIGMRNIIVHDYGNVDLKKVWNTAIYDIPELKNNCEEML
ncbi:MAG: DUF86 domain-containing protein [Oscillospiraceae bacterium]|jgi:uncharacterized protein with HEPN domain|nr:DUF86 domain-containing protein [Oscillospiraceae bacterium]